MIRIMKKIVYRMLLLALPMLVFYTTPVSAHCDSYDGPVIKDALTALETGHVDPVLKWVDETREQEIIELFGKTLPLRTGDQEIYALVEKHFLETLVRLHREFEGAPFTGLKPAGNVPPIVRMADNSVETGSAEELKSRFLGHIERVLDEKYQLVNALHAKKDESVEYGRAYVHAYVDYVHFLEGIHGILEHGAGHAGHDH